MKKHILRRLLFLTTLFSILMHCESNITTPRGIITPTAVQITSQIVYLVDSSAAFTAQITPVKASYDSLVWISSNENVLQFLSNGMAIPKSSGACKICAAVAFDNKIVYSQNIDLTVVYHSKCISAFPPEIKVNNTWTYIETYSHFEPTKRPGSIVKIKIDSIDAVGRKTFWYAETSFTISGNDTIYTRSGSISMENPPTEGLFSYLGYILDTTGNKIFTIEDTSYNVVEYCEIRGSGYSYNDFLPRIGLVYTNRTTGLGGLYIHYLLSFENAEHQIQEFYSTSSFEWPQD